MRSSEEKQGLAVLTVAVVKSLLLRPGFALHLLVRPLTNFGRKQQVYGRRPLVSLLVLIHPF